MIKSGFCLGIEGNKVQEINYLKGFSIFTIVLMHLMQCMSALPSQINTLASIGGTGVHVFFLCSGIGLYLSYLNRKTSFKDFIDRRFKKIYIPYIIVVLISFFLPWLYKGADRFWALLSHVFLYKMFVPKYEESFGTQFWFVSTIIQLYLLFIPMCRLKEKMKNNIWFFGLFFFVSFLWWIFCYIVGVSNERIWNSFCLQYIWEFALGVVIADELKKGKTITISNWLLLICAFVGIGMQAGMAFFSESLKVFNDVPALLGYTSLALLLMNIPVIKKVGLVLSEFSYEFFLVHMLIFSSVFYFVKPQGIVRQMVIGVVALVLALGISYIYKKQMQRLFKCTKSK